MTTGDPAPPAPITAPAPRRPRRTLPALAALFALALAVGIMARRHVPAPAPPPVVPAYTPQQAAQAERHLDALRQQLEAPAPTVPEIVSTAAPASPTPGRPAPPAETGAPRPAATPAGPRPVRLQVSQDDLNTYLATNPSAKAALTRNHVRAVQILFQGPRSVVVRAAILSRGQVQNVQITGELQPSQKTVLRFVVGKAQIGRVPLPAGAVTAQADRLAAQLTRRFQGRLPLAVRDVSIHRDRLILSGTKQ